MPARPAPSPSPATARTTVHLLRHGEVENPDKVLYGRLPGYHLSALGRSMAQVAAAHLSAFEVTHLVCSPLERAQETMQPLADRLSLPVTLDERVIEAANTFEGLTVGARPLQLAAPRFWPHLRNPFTPSWGEPYAQIAERMGAAVQAARAAASGHHAVIVSHQLPIWTMRQAAERRRLWHDPRSRQCTLASVTSLSFVGEDLVGVDYAEPAAALLPQARTAVPGR